MTWSSIVTTSHSRSGGSLTEKTSFLFIWMTPLTPNLTNHTPFLGTGSTIPSCSKRLTAEKAKTVVFDIVFTDRTDPSRDPPGSSVDKDFAQAMLENGNVVLATDFSTDQYNGEGMVGSGGFVPLYPMFDDAAADKGSDALAPEKGESVRQYWAGPPRPQETISSEAWAAAVLVNPSLSHVGYWFAPGAINHLRPFADKLIAKEGSGFQLLE